MSDGEFKQWKCILLVSRNAGVIILVQSMCIDFSQLLVIPTKIFASRRARRRLLGPRTWKLVETFISPLECKIWLLCHVNDNNDNDKRLGLTAKADQPDHKKKYNTLKIKMDNKAVQKLHTSFFCVVPFGRMWSPKIGGDGAPLQLVACALCIDYSCVLPYRI